MRLRPFFVLAPMALAATLLARHPADALDRRAQIAVTIGPRKITVGEIEDRLAQVPRFQLTPLGVTDAEIRRRFLDEVIIPEVLLSLGAEARKIDAELPTSYQLENVLAQATLRAVRAKVGTPAKIPMEDVQRYYDANKSSYDSPERFGVWRIVVKSEDEARAIEAELKKKLDAETFGKLAREKSLDKATYLRSGNLGYIALDGMSNEPGVKVDPAIPKAAAQVKDGQLVPDPVKEGDSWAIVWRKSYVAASHRSVEDAAAQIRDTLWKQRVEQAQKALLDELRAKNVREVSEQRLAGFEISLTNGGIAPRGRPGQVAPQKK